MVIYEAGSVSFFKAIIKQIILRKMLEINNTEQNDSFLQLHHERWVHQDKCHIKNLEE